jgi:hypothetical protein
MPKSTRQTYAEFEFEPESESESEGRQRRMFSGLMSRWTILCLYRCSRADTCISK